MLRKAFVMQLYPGNEDAYITRHNPIWPQLEQVLKSHGVSNYSIFLEPDTLKLFAYAEIESEERWKAIASTEICAQWWQSMKHLMASNQDASPVSHELREMFHLD